MDCPGRRTKSVMVFGVLVPRTGAIRRGGEFRHRQPRDDQPQRYHMDHSHLSGGQQLGLGVLVPRTGAIRRGGEFRHRQPRDDQPRRYLLDCAHLSGRQQLDVGVLVPRAQSIRRGGDFRHRQPRDDESVAKFHSQARPARAFSCPEKPHADHRTATAADHAAGSRPRGRVPAAPQRGDGPPPDQHPAPRRGLPRPYRPRVRPAALRARAGQRRRL
ncbi:hypothetical protein OF001_U20085 [Pseudomonas sp. OF001]|nr:hypothetical protein OF001_U20085 [Pseudomonas sp. OF001]